MGQRNNLLTFSDAWGAADVQAAVDAIPDWMEAVKWNGLKAALNDWIVSGHSNGGVHFPFPLARVECLTLGRPGDLVPVDSSARQSNCCGSGVWILVNRKYDHLPLY